MKMWVLSGMGGAIRCVNFWAGAGEVRLAAPGAHLAASGAHLEASGVHLVA